MSGWPRQPLGAAQGWHKAATAKALLVLKHCHQCSSPIMKAIDERSGCNPSLGAGQHSRGAGFASCSAELWLQPCCAQCVITKFSVPRFTCCGPLKAGLKESKGPGRFRSCPDAQVGQEDTQHYSHTSLPRDNGEGASFQVLRSSRASPPLVQGRGSSHSSTPAAAAAALCLTLS